MIKYSKSINNLIKYSKSYPKFNLFLYYFIGLFALLMCAYASISLAQEVVNPDVAVPAAPAGAAAAGPVPLLLTVKLGTPDSNATSQVFQINSGETAFVQTSTPPATAQQTPAEKQAEQEYKRNLAKISTAISGKVTQLQNKQTSINNEIYIAQVPPLQNDLRGLQDELNTLEQSRTKLVADRTAYEASKPPPPPAPPPDVANGINIRPAIEKDGAVMTVSTQDGVTSTIEAPLGQWVQVFSNEDGTSVVWAKIEARS